MKLVRVLILEDDLETLFKLTQAFIGLQKRFKDLDFAITTLAEYTQVENYLNRADENTFDIILLDRDCKACGSFHCLDLNKYPAERIIGISSVPSYNEELKHRGVIRLVNKDYQALDKFIAELEVNIIDLLRLE